jgi:hypothetical protein
MAHPSTTQAGASTLIADIESEIETLSDRAAACKKAMLASKLAFSIGGFLTIAMVVGVVHFPPILMPLGIAALIGGLVGFGSNRSTLLETQARIKILNLRRLELIDTLTLRVIED